MSFTPDTGKKDGGKGTPVGEFTPMGKQSAGRIGSDIFSELTERMPTWTMNRGDLFRSSAGRDRNTNYDNNINNNTTNLHRMKKVSEENYDDDDVVALNSSAASSVREENGNVRNEETARLFGRDGVHNGRNILPNFNQNQINNNNIINEDGTNMVKEQLEKLKKLEVENTNLKVEVVTLRQEFKGIPTDSAKLINENIELKKQILHLKQNPIVTNNNDKVYELENIINENKREMNLLRDKYQNTLDEKEKLIHLKFEYESKIKELEDELTNISHNNLNSQGLEEKIEFLSDEKYRVENENDQLHNKIDELEDEIMKKDDKIEQLKQEIDEMENSNEKVSHMEPNSSIIEDLNNEIKDLKLQVRELEQENNDKDQKLTNKFHSWKDERDNLINKLEDSSNSINKLSKDNNELKDLELDLRDEIKKLSVQIQKQLKTIESLQENVVSNGNDVSNNNREIMEQLEEYKDTVNTLEIDNKNLNLDRKDLYQNLKKAEQTIKELEKKIEMLEAQYEDDGDEDDVEDDVENDDHDEIYQQIYELKEDLEKEREAHEQTKSIADKIEEQYAILYEKFEESSSKSENSINDYIALRREYDDLKETHEKLLKSDVTDQLSDDLAKLSIEYKKIKDEKMSVISNYKEQLNLLEYEISSKNDEIERYKRQLKRLVESEVPIIDTESINSKITELSNKVNELNIDKRKLEDSKIQLEDENSKLKVEIEKFSKYKEYNDEIKSNITKLEDDKRVLRLGLKERKLEIERLNNIIEKINSEMNDLRTVNRRINEETDGILDKTTEISHKVEKKELVNSFKIKEYDMKIEEYESKIEEQKKQYNSIVEEYNFMKDELIGKIKELKESISNSNNDDEIRRLKGKIEILENRNRLLERNINNWTPPTPESPSRVEGRLNILQSQKGLAMLKLKEYGNKLRDLRFMIEYYKLMIKNRDESISICKRMLKNGGIRVDIGDEKRLKPINKLRGVIYVVIANIRFKKKLEELKHYKAEEMRLKNEIRRY